MHFRLQDELARVFVTLFDAKHLLAPLLWNMFYKEVEVSDCMQTLFRGNSLASKVFYKYFFWWNCKFWTFLLLIFRLWHSVSKSMAPPIFTICYNLS